MAQKLKTQASAISLGDRIAKALREGRTQQALELARQNYKHDPSAENLATLRQATFARGRQLQSQGDLKDAATVYANAIDMGGAPEFLAELAERLAACGAAAPALKLQQQLPDTARDAARGKILGNLVDSALRQGPAGRAGLPADLQPPFGLIVQAFAHAEQGRDDDARAALQGIGLQSPFLEWKLLLRGLLGWYANDDARALDNWQRLDPARLPWRTAAPFRAMLDSAFRDAQPPATQEALRQLADRAGGSGLVRPLQAIQQLLATDVSQALRQVQPLVPGLRKDHPDLAARLAQCFFWAIVDKGEPRDTDRYLRAFGAPPDDPRLDRLHALATEQRGLVEDAQELWQAYERQIAAHPTAWPGAQAMLARALIWEHLGDISVGERTLGRLNRRARSLGEGAADIRSAEECYRRSLELAPERLAPREAQIRWHMVQREPEKALRAAMALLERFPDHVPTLTAMAGLLRERKEYAQAQQHIERALTLNPLDARLRIEMTWLHQAQALALVSQRGKKTLPARLEQARRHYEQALGYQDQRKTLLRCRLAVLEALAGQPDRAAAWVAEALAEPHQTMAAAHTLKAECARARLPAAPSKALFAQVAASPAAGPAATGADELYGLIEVVRLLHHYPPYRGQKTDAKKALGLLGAACLNALSELALVRLCGYLQELDAGKPLIWAYQAGQRRFPANPEFLLAEAVSLLKRRGHRQYSFDYRLRHLLKRARDLAVKLPRELQDDILHRIEFIDQSLAPADDPFGMLQEIFGTAFDDEPDDDY
ncbi:MAG: transcriptional repressor TCF25 family protein [Gemmataceae bacterium]|nr:transcriptional repressor TCF25 family protein [Gemmataceae bacterium]